MRSRPRTIGSITAVVLLGEADPLLRSAPTRRRGIPSEREHVSCGETDLDVDSGALQQIHIVAKPPSGR